MKTVFILLASLVLAPPVHAYLDPGSGSMMIQLLLAGAAGAAVALKIFWRRLLTFFGFYKKTPPDPTKPSV